MRTEKPIFFVSCGQVTPEERQLGLKISELINGTEVFEGYFADNQSSLEGVTQNIFAQLGRCFGLICVMQAYRDIATYHTHLRTMENIQDHGSRANHVSMYVGPAKNQARQTVARAIKILKELVA